MQLKMNLKIEQLCNVYFDIFIFLVLFYPDW